MLLAVNLQSESAYDQRIVLSSPPYSIDERSCLTIKYQTQATHVVYMSCLPNASVLENQVREIYYIDSTSTALSNQLRDLQLNIVTVNPDNSECSINLALNASAIGSVAQIYKIQLLRGPCQPIGS